MNWQDIIEYFKTPCIPIWVFWAYAIVMWIAGYWTASAGA